MAFTTFSGPVRSNNGYAEPITYIKATDVVNDEVHIPAGGSVVILSAADGGPTGTITLVLPLVETTNGGSFTITNADKRYAGIRGSVLNYDTSITHVLGGYGTNDSTSTTGQKVNLSDTGVEIDTETIVQWGGNGNPDAPWAAITSDLAPAA